MADETEQQEPPVEQLEAKLKQALKSCRSVVSDYRAKLNAADKAANEDDELDPDRAESR